MNSLLLMFIAVVGFNIAMFVPAFIYKTDKLTDISYALSFVALILFALFRSTQRWPHLILAMLVLWWAARLGGFLLMRIWKKGKDKRFDGMRDNVLLFLRFWLLQGASVFVVLLASLLFMQSESPRINILSVVGAVIFILGLYIESVADLEKWYFTQDKNNKGKWIESGIWARSRHPNYFGEMLVWVGLYAFVVPSLHGNQWFIALLSPVYIIILLFFVSGIPILEKSADKKWGDNKDYRAYKKRVPLLLPKLK